MNQQALEFVMNMYQVDRITALQLYWDEIEAAERILAWDIFNKDVEDARDNL